MLNYLCLAFRYANQATDRKELLKLAKLGAVSFEKTPQGWTKYLMSDGSALIDKSGLVQADENNWWLK